MLKLIPRSSALPKIFAVAVLVVSNASAEVPALNVWVTKNGQKISDKCPTLLSGIQQLVQGSGTINLGSFDEMATILHKAGYPEKKIEPFLAHLVRVMQRTEDHEGIQSFLNYLWKATPDSPSNLELLVCGVSEDCLFGENVNPADHGLKLSQYISSVAGIELMAPTAFRKLAPRTQGPSAQPVSVSAHHSLVFRMPPVLDGESKPAQFIGEMSQW